MSNLIEKYGPDWFRQKFNGTFFLHEGKPARIVDAGSRAVVAQIMDRNPTTGNIEGGRFTLSPDDFPDSSKFVVPELGYRHTRDGAYLSFLYRNNSSYVRGLSIRNLQQRLHPLTRMLQNRGLSITPPNEDELTYLAMKPEFLPLHSGISKMLRGELVSFAASPTLAVVPSTNQDSELTILFCSKAIGTVDANGNMSLSSPIANDYIEALNNDQ